jgi:hypothetical protein
MWRLVVDWEERRETRRQIRGEDEKEQSLSLMYNPQELSEI